MKKRRAPPRSRSAAPRAAVEAPRAPTYDDILAIARLIESGSRFSEFRLRSGDIEVEVKRGNGAAPAHPVVPAEAGTQPRAQASGSPIAAAPAASGMTDGGSAAASGMTGGGSAAAPGMTGGGSAAAARMTVGDLPPGTQVIKSPMVGTFYRSPDPSAPPFVDIGQRVEPDTIVCIIEVMKLMNSVTAGMRGVVTHVFVENAQPVEFGQPLVAIRPEK